MGHPLDRPMDADAIKFADSFGADLDTDVEDLGLAEGQTGVCGCNTMAACRF